MSSRECKNSLNCFCYVCGFYISDKHTTCKIVKGTKYWTAYRLYFGMDIGDQDKPWAPHVICGSCRSNLEGWLGVLEKLFYLQFPEFGESPKIIMMIAIFA